MNESQENNFDKKKIVPVLVAVFTLLVFVVGATYAFFRFNSESEFGSTTINGSTGSQMTGVVLKNKISELSLNLTGQDMLVTNGDTIYYASPSGKTTTETINTIAETEIEDEINTYNCTYTLTITDKSSEEDSLYNAFQEMSTKSEGQIVLAINDSDYDFNTEDLFPITYNGKMKKITHEEIGKIETSLYIKNEKNIDQTALATKEIKLEYKISNFSCELKIVEPGQAEAMIELASEDTTNGLWQSSLVGDGYRYVGTNPDNYICFGTTDKDTCIGDTDKYMYRIIGIFSDGEDWHYKLIKKEALNSTYNWDDNYTSDVNWNESTLYTNINGSVFLTSNSYSYLQNTNWTNRIENWTWSAVNTKTNGNSGPNYNNIEVQQVYYHEMNNSLKNNSNGAWTQPSGKIGLMYLSDYLLSLGSSTLNYNSNSNRSTLKTGWMHLSHNDSGAPGDSEYIISRSGERSNGGYGAWAVYFDGLVYSDSVDAIRSVRPVFYLTSDQTIKPGSTGSIDDPYILQVD